MNIGAARASTAGHSSPGGFAPREPPYTVARGGPGAPLRSGGARLRRAALRILYSLSSSRTTD